MMTLEQFKAAVDSLKDFKGIVGVMGGEPTLNPHFTEMIKYLAKARPSGKRSPKLIAPVRDFNRFHQGHWNSLIGARRGVFSALGPKFYDNLELISDIFPYQCLNDHKNSGLHQALLIPRKELGISDEEFYPLRDKCWIQNSWSASITPKGAFFCEIAAALDMLFDGPGGWPVEPGWWRRTPDEFGDQLKYCELCSAALAVPQIEGNMETDIVSPEMWQRLKDRKAWKISNNRCVVFDTASYDKEKYSLNYDGEPYLSDDDIRVSQDTGSTLFPHDIAVLSDDAYAEFSGVMHSIDAADAAKMHFEDWLLIVHEKLPAETEEFIRHAVFNPGVFYYSGDGKCVFFNRKALALAGVESIDIDNIASVKRLYPSCKRYRWESWRTPDKLSFREKFFSFKDRVKNFAVNRIFQLFKSRSND
jgi:hypothetical protein